MLLVLLASAAAVCACMGIEWPRAWTTRGGSGPGALVQQARFGPFVKRGSCWRGNVARQADAAEALQQAMQIMSMGENLRQSDAIRVVQLVQSAAQGGHVE